MVLARLAAPVLVAMLALVSGCSPTSPPDVAVAPTPAADAVTTAVMRSKGLGTAALTVDAIVELDGMSRTIRAEGVSVLGSGDGRLELVAADGPATILVNGKGVFTRAHGGDPWTRTQDRGSVAGARLTDPLAGLGGMRAVRQSDGTTFSGTIPATTDALQQLGLSAPEAAEAVAAGPVSDIAVRVLLDGSGRVAHIDRTVTLANGRASTTTVLSDYRIGVDLASPPSGSVQVTGQQ